ncbi:uncharacterized protein LOC126840959 [Adelges cooleyi]|uniref:uncharacterized protein LOC126840959 n=1 Tax=Adelges cooleyi TaxID=133065 RepID=UPI00217FC4E4|nr:uncharacterized protein LOC126840959 [Adelges cooleyi]
MFPSYIFIYFLLVAPALAFIQPNILWLDENEVCKKDSSSRTHVCKSLDKCESAIQDIRDNVAYPTICSIRGKMPVVCCSPTSKSGGRTDGKPSEVDNNDRRQQDPFEIPPGVLLHFTKHHNGLLQDNTITFSRPRRR